MNTARLLCVVAAVAWTSVSSATTLSLPSYFKVCSRNDPKFKECAIQNGRSIISHVIHGDPELNIPDLDPLDVSDIPIEGPLGLKLSDVKIYGLEKAILQDFNIDFAKQNMSYKFLMPKCVVLGNYAANGAWSDFDINGKGNFNFTLDNLVFVLSLPYDLVTRDDGKQYMELKSNTRINLKASKAYINMDHISENDDDLSKLINEFLNEHWQEVLGDFSPTLGKITSETIRKAFASMTKIPFNDFFHKE